MSGASAVGASGTASPVGVNTPVVGGSVPAIQESQGGGKGAANSQSPMGTQQPQINPYQNSSYTQMFNSMPTITGASANTRYIPKQYSGSGATAITTDTAGPLGQNSIFTQGNYGGGIDFGSNNTTSNPNSYTGGLLNSIWGQAPSAVSDQSSYSDGVGGFSAGNTTDSPGNPNQGAGA